MDLKVACRKISDRFKVSSWSLSIVVHFFLLGCLFFAQADQRSSSSVSGHVGLMSGSMTLRWDYGNDKSETDGGDGETAGAAPVEATVVVTPEIKKIISVPLSNIDLSSLLPKSASVEQSVSAQNNTTVSPVETTAPSTRTIGDGSGLGTDGDGTGRGGGFGPGNGKTTVGFFGTTGIGSRFVYVFDRSESMSEYGGRPMRAAKEELIRSLGSLDDSHRFNIIFYNDEYEVWSPEQLHNATDIKKENARTYIGGIVPTGGTEHRDPLTEAIRLKPDVIFFLTDGDENDALSPSELEDITTLNGKGKGVQINVVQFGVGESNNMPNFLKTLAARNGGQYMYVDVSTLP